MLARGAMPRRVIFSGMGLAGLLETGRRVDFFRRVLSQPGSHARGTPEFLADAFLKTTGGDPVAPEVLGALAALRRSTEIARQMAYLTGTDVILARDGRLVRLSPSVIDAGLGDAYWLAFPPALADWKRITSDMWTAMQG